MSFILRHPHPLSSSLCLSLSVCLSVSVSPSLPLCASLFCITIYLLSLCHCPSSLCISLFFFFFPPPIPQALWPSSSVFSSSYTLCHRPISGSHSLSLCGCLCLSLSLSLSLFLSVSLSLSINVYRVIFKLYTYNAVPARKR